MELYAKNNDSKEVNYIVEFISYIIFYLIAKKKNPLKNGILS